VPVIVRRVVYTCKVNSNRDWEHSIRMQWTPSRCSCYHISILHHAGSPFIVRIPEPSIIIIIVPSAIMISDVSEGSYAIPIPAIVSPNPSSDIIRHPVSSNNCCLQTTTPYINFNPGFRMEQVQYRNIHPPVMMSFCFCIKITADKKNYCKNLWSFHFTPPCYVYGSQSSTKVPREFIWFYLILSWI